MMKRKSAVRAAACAAAAALALALLLAVFPAAATETAAPTDSGKKKNIIYMEDFSSAGEGTEGDALMNALGWTVLAKDNGSAPKNNTAKYSIRDGRLFVNNYNGVSGGDSYVRILPSAQMRDAALGDYTVQYDLEYAAASEASRYIAVLHEYSESTNGYYNSFHLRVNASGNNECRFNGDWFKYDVAGPYWAEDTDDSDGTSTIARKILSRNYTGGAMLIGVNLTIRIKCSADAAGPEVWIRNNSLGGDFVKVSEASVSGTAANYWRSNSLTGHSVVLKTGGAADGYIDNILIYSGTDEPRFEDEPETAAPDPENSEEPGNEKKDRPSIFPGLWENHQTGKYAGWAIVCLIGAAAFVLAKKKKE